MVMALDHVRDSFHSAAMSGSPADLATTRNARASADDRSEWMVGHSENAAERILLEIGPLKSRTRQ
jgi:hypothetical protein